MMTEKEMDDALAGFRASLDQVLAAMQDCHERWYLKMGEIHECGTKQQQAELLLMIAEFGMKLQERMGQHD